jgi:Ca-activated chloride channel family protein
MNFVYPYLFLMMGFPLLLFVFFMGINKTKLSHVFDEKVLKRLSAADEGISVKFRNILMILALLLMITSLARPVFELGDKKVEVEGLTLLAALDISGSMRSEDVYPNRLEFAKKKISALFDVMPSDKISVAAFAYSTFVLAPFSTDKETLKMMVEGVDDSYINMGSTDFSALGEVAAKLLEDKKSKILLMFTDGGDEEAIAGFSSILKENGIDLYVVLVGTEQGAPVLDEEGNALTSRDGKVAITQRNDALGALAKDNDGAFVIASNGDEDIRELVLVIRSKYENQQQGEVTVKERTELFYYPLGLGLLFLLLSSSSLPRRKNV